MKSFLTILLFVVSFNSTQAVCMWKGSSEDALSPRNLNFAQYALPALTIAAHVLRPILHWENEQNVVFATRDFENRGVFILTNERNNQETVAKMHKMPPRGNVGVGVSALFNMELFLARAHHGISHWVIVDPAIEVRNFWVTFIDSFARANSLRSAIHAVRRAMIEHRTLFFTEYHLLANGLLEEDVYEECVTHALARAQEQIMCAMGNIDFEKLRNLVSTGILLLPTDLADPNAIEALKQWLFERGFTIDTIYASNVDVHVPTLSIETFRKNLESLRCCSIEPSYVIQALPKTDHPLDRKMGRCYQRISF